MHKKLLYSPKLKQGDLVRLVSPASYLPQSDIAVNADVLASWGFDAIREHMS